MHSILGELITNPQIEDIPFHETKEKYRPRDSISNTLAQVTFQFRFQPLRPPGHFSAFGQKPEDKTITTDVEIQGELAIKVSQSLKCGDKCTLKFRSIPGSGTPIYPDDITF